MARKKKITKDQVIKATRELIQTEGVHNITTRRIAKTGGFSTQPIYYDFASVDELVTYTIQTIVDEFTETMEKLKAEKLTLLELDVSFLDYIKEEVALAKILISDTIFAKKAYELLTNTSYNLLNKSEKENAELRKALEHNWHVMTAVSALEINKAIEINRELIVDLLRNQIELLNVEN